MLLFSLTLLLIVLMVCLTLSIATKAKEKMELQVIADTAAYSNAIVTARVFNEIALMNRAQTAQMVSMAGVQSLINWSSFHRAQIEGVRQSYGMARLPYIPLLFCCNPKSGCFSYCRCAIRALNAISRSRSCMQREQRRISSFWNQAEQGAADQTRLLQGLASAFVGYELNEYRKLSRKINNQRLAGNIVRQAARGTPYAHELSAPASADDENNDEISLLGGAVLPLALLGRDHHISAAMGSRGFTFTTTRGTGGMMITSRLSQLVNTCGQDDTTYATDSGEAYWGRDESLGRYRNVSGMYSWAVDRGFNVTFFNRGTAPCPTTSVGFASVRSTLRSTDSNDNSDAHRWSPRSGTLDSEPATRRHDLLACIGTDCPGMWPLFMDYNQIRGMMRGDNFGQPRNFATIQRDYSRRSGSPDPWNLLFRFRYTPAGESFDGRGIRMQSANGRGIDISKQTAVSTGIAYYHRGTDGMGSHWREPPNFLNPFWRATLVSSAVEGDTMLHDSGRDNDIRGPLRDANVPWAADAHRALERARFQGWQ